MTAPPAPTLEMGRSLVADGEPLAEAAVAVGFADQSHFTRHFVCAYGMTPGRWAALVGARRR